MEDDSYMTMPPTNGMEDMPSVDFLLYMSLHIRDPEKNWAIVTMLAIEPITPL